MTHTPPPPSIERHVALGPYTTLGVGGIAEWYLRASTRVQVTAAVAWADERGLPRFVLGGGSNVVLADGPLSGLCLAVDLRGIEVSYERAPGEQTGDEQSHDRTPHAPLHRDQAHGPSASVVITAGAGEPWDGLVDYSVSRGWSGIECLSGIPGLVGATPIQNVGAYGQEVSDTVVRVQCLDTHTLELCDFDNPSCEFTYRSSRFKAREPGRHIVLAVSYRLAATPPVPPRYPQLAESLGNVQHPPVELVRQHVLALRRAKSMLAAAGDPNRRSCGSFFLNPMVAPERYDAIAASLPSESVPHYPAPPLADGTRQVKLSAAWLIERAGFVKGHRQGSVGLSTQHTLALVCHDGACSADLLDLAAQVRQAVHARFGVSLVPEPEFVGFDRRGALWQRLFRVL